MKYLDQLRKARKRGEIDKRPIKFPVLRVEQNVAPLSNQMAPFQCGSYKRMLPKDANVYPVGNNHKQGFELLTPGTLAQGHHKLMNGKKQ